MGPCEWHTCTHFNPIHCLCTNSLLVNLCIGTFWHIIKSYQHTCGWLLGMRPQMETALYYLVLIKEAINNRCVKSITAASLRQNKHGALERKCLKIKTHSGESWGKVECNSARVCSPIEVIVKPERGREIHVLLLLSRAPAAAGQGLCWQLDVSLESAALWLVFKIK